MKFILFFLLLIVTSCSKEVLEVVPEPDCGCVTVYVDQYGDDWVKDTTFVSLGPWYVCDSALNVYKAYYKTQMETVGNRGYYVCPPIRDFTRMEIVNGKCK